MFPIDRLFARLTTRVYTRHADEIRSQILHAYILMYIYIFNINLYIHIHIYSKGNGYTM